MEYVNLVKSVIKNVKKQYAVDNLVDIDQISDSELQFCITDQLFLETLLMEIRGKTISFSSYLKKQRDRTEELIIKEIGELEKCETLDENKIAEKREQLYNLRKEKLQGLMIRTKAKWIEEGEIPSKYFLHLENRHFSSKHMPFLWKTDNTKTKDEHEIIHEASLFYENLYEFRCNKEVDFGVLL